MGLSSWRTPGYCLLVTTSVMQRCGLLWVLGCDSWQWHRVLYREQQFKVIYGTWCCVLQRLLTPGLCPCSCATDRYLQTSAKRKSALGRAGGVIAVWAIIKRTLAPWKVNWDEPVSLWLMYLQTTRWLALGVRGRSSPKPEGHHRAALAPLPHLLPVCSAAAGAAQHSQETGTTKPNFLIPASIGCDGFGTNSKQHHMAIHPNALQPGEGTRVAASPLPQHVLLSPFCSVRYLKACMLEFQCGLCTKGYINSQLSIQGNFF